MKSSVLDTSLTYRDILECADRLAFLGHKHRNDESSIALFHVSASLYGIVPRKIRAARYRKEIT